MLNEEQGLERVKFPQPRQSLQHPLATDVCFSRLGRASKLEVWTCDRDVVTALCCGTQNALASEAALHTHTSLLHVARTLTSPPSGRRDPSSRPHPPTFPSRARTFTSA